MFGGGKNMKKMLLHTCRYICLLTVIIVGLVAVIGTGGGDGGGDGGGEESNTYYRDDDGDGFGNPYDMKIAFRKPSGYVENATDCDDDDATVYPGAEELCFDDIDNDCDGDTDEGCVLPTPCTDADGDGYFAEADCGTGVDCDDSNATVYPFAEEICGDQIDNDCDQDIDEGCGLYYEDADEDGFGNADVSVNMRSAPLGYVEDNTDCDDTDADVNPGAPELCDRTDNNCNNVIDEGCRYYYQDVDGDKYGNAAKRIYSRICIGGYVRNNADCNDDDPGINPAAVEVCYDDMDNNCNGIIDEGCDFPD